MVRTPAGRSWDERSNPMNAPVDAAYSRRKHSSHSDLVGRKLNDPNALDVTAKVLLLVVVPPAMVDARAAGENAGPNIITKANTLPISIRCGVRLDKVRERR